MTSKIILDSITLQSNPTAYSEPISINVTFSALESLSSPLEWKVIYVGSAYSEDHDQTLEVFEI